MKRIASVKSKTLRTKNLIYEVCDGKLVSFGILAGSGDSFRQGWKLFDCLVNDSLWQEILTQFGYGPATARYVQAYPVGLASGHAWVEIKCRGKIYCSDASRGEIWKKREYYARLKPKAIRRYTLDESLLKMSETGAFQMWHERA